VIDLRNDTAAIGAWCREGIRAFAQEYPDTVVATVALYACPWAGWLLLTLDTPEHSNSHVARWGSRGIPWIGKDEYGMFCDNPPDFAFNEWRSFECDHWRAEYEGSAPLVINHDGVTVQPPTRDGQPGYEGDEGYNRVFHPALVASLRNVELDSGFGGVNRAAPFRLGVSMVDSRLSVFWAV
jgi:hypothetical protein